MGSHAVALSHPSDIPSTSLSRCRCSNGFCRKMMSTSAGHYLKKKKRLFEKGGRGCGGGRQREGRQHPQVPAGALQGR